MTITYRTVVLRLDATPLGLLPEEWKVEHWCSLCRQPVEPDQLVAHAQRHEGVRVDNDSGLPWTRKAQWNLIQSTRSDRGQRLPVSPAT